MQVRAKAIGFYVGRRRAGDVFDMPDTAMKKDGKGKAILPSWVEAFDDKPSKPSRQAGQEKIEPANNGSVSNQEVI